MKYEPNISVIEISDFLEHRIIFRFFGCGGDKTARQWQAI
jgi:hypothetical protein